MHIFNLLLGGFNDKLMSKQLPVTCYDSHSPEVQSLKRPSSDMSL